jgi:hypothetical protein
VIQPLSEAGTAVIRVEEGTVVGMAGPWGKERGMVVHLEESCQGVEIQGAWGIPVEAGCE